MTAVLAIKPGHDGAIALVENGRLVFSLEGEKDSLERNGPVTGPLLADALALAPAVPDIIAVGGWHKVLPGVSSGIEAGYRGLDAGSLIPASVLGHRVLRYSSSHERSHIFGGVAMSPFDPGGEMVVLVWEGVIGSFYLWSDGGRSLKEYPVLGEPGGRYGALFALADPAFPDRGGFIESSLAGKLMALAAFADDRPPTADTEQVVRSLLGIGSVNPFDKARYRHSPLYNGGTAPELCRAARLLSDEIFTTFRRVAYNSLPRGLPLVVSGGCGLNCDWNRAWDESGLFSAVSVAPCANDSGSAIGTAVDAAVQVGDACRLEWDVYRGAEFIDDIASAPGWFEQPVDEVAVSRILDTGEVVAWIQGRCEIGPRALGHRSLLASARHSESRDRLNEIKGRESYRPIAPVCLEGELGRWFDSEAPDHHMLRFRRVLRPDVIPAVTHVDGSARVQSVTASSCAELHALLVAHRAATGTGMLCNTSLNFPGRGFINRTSEVLAFCDVNGVNHAVVGGRWFERDGGP